MGGVHCPPCSLPRWTEDHHERLRTAPSLRTGEPDQRPSGDTAGRVTVLQDLTLDSQSSYHASIKQLLRHLSRGETPATLGCTGLDTMGFQSAGAPA
jgi:hypothetical protein